VNTVKNYTEYLENSFLIFFVNQFSYSGGKQSISPKKVYCIDTGLRNAVSFKFSDDLGRAIENLVFIELKRRSSEAVRIAMKGGKECPETYTTILFFCLLASRSAYNRLQRLFKTNERL
jgi:predicted AAA+ superfamily ATPase